MRPLAACLFVMVVTAVPARAGAADEWSDPFPGVRRLHRTTSSQHINVTIIDLCAAGVSVRATGSSERGRTASSFGGLVGAQLVINGDFYGSGYATNGPAMSAGVAWGGSDHGYVAPVQFGAGVVAMPGHEGSAGVEPWAREVVSGHPTLLASGVPRDNNGDSLCTVRHPRTVLGLSADKSQLISAVIDGRATGRIGMTCDEMIDLMEEMGAHDAVNLDGGGSSTMWLQGTGVVNYPSDGSQRVVANHLAVYASGAGASPHCAPRYDAEFVASDAPLEMRSGQEAVVWIELRNHGNTTWDLDLTRAGTQEPRDRDSAFFKDGNWISPSRPSGADHSTYTPGSIGRFTWVMKAPEVAESTAYVETFQLVQEGVAWFGPTMTMAITVHPAEGPSLPPGEEPPRNDDDPYTGALATDEGRAEPASAGCSAAGGGDAGVLLVLVCAAVLRRRGLHPKRPRTSC